MAFGGARRVRASRPTVKNVSVTITLAAAALVLAAPAAVRAQNLRPVLTDDDGPLTRLKPRPQPTRPAQSAAVPEASQGAPRMRPSVASEDAPADTDGSADTDPAPSPYGVRPTIRDGDPEAALEPEAIIDGAPEEPETYRNPDGEDAVQWDAREPADADAFTRPPAGYDGPAFGVELSPLEDRRPAFLYRFEPWQPRGVRLGSFTVYPQADIGAAWVSNLFRTPRARSDAALEFRPTMRVVSNWRTHALELRATGGFTYFDEFPREGDRAYSLDARGRLDVTRRTQVSGGLSHEVAQETRGTLDSRLRGGPRADVETSTARLQVDHRFNRLAVQLRGAYQQRDYEDVSNAGVLLSNRDRNLRSTEEAARVSWTFKPTFIGFFETALNQRRFEAPSSVDGIKRDSDGERYRVGIGFGNTGNVLRGEASIGYGRQNPLDSRLGSIDGLVIDANLAWRMSALTALLLRGSTDVSETLSLQSAGGFTRRAGVEVRHAVLRPLIVSASAGYATTAYQGILINDHLTELAAGVEYYLAPEAVLYGRYTHSMQRSNAAGGSWDADEVRVGVRIRR